MVSFYKAFFIHASEYTGPLSNLLKKLVRESLQRNDDILARFHQLKLALSSEPVINLPDLHLSFLLMTDVSNHGLGAVLLQYHKE